MATTNWWNLYTQIDAVLAGQTTIIARLNALQANIMTLQKGAKNMADVLDQVNQQLATIGTDVATLQTDVAQAVTIMQGVAAGQISANDPRFQQALNTMTNVDQALQTMAQSLSAAEQPAPAPQTKP